MGPSDFNWPDGSQDATALTDEWRFHALPARTFGEPTSPYGEAARMLLEAVARGESPDHVFLPLGFLLRHRLELLLKENIVLWAEIRGDAKWSDRQHVNTKLRHNLMKLWNRFGQLSLDDETSSSDRQAHEDAADSLQTFLTLEPDATGFRYERAVGGQKHARPDRVDLRSMYAAADAVATYLTGAYDYAYEGLQAEREALRDVRGY